MKPGLAYLAKQRIVPGCRWTPQRKEHFIVACDQFAEESAALMELYQISAEELTSWIRAHERGRRRGLHATYVAPRSER